MSLLNLLCFILVIMVKPCTRARSAGPVPAQKRHKTATSATVTSPTHATSNLVSTPNVIDPAIQTVIAEQVQKLGETLTNQMADMLKNASDSTQVNNTPQPRNGSGVGVGTANDTQTLDQDQTLEQVLQSVLRYNSKCTDT